MAKLQLFQDDDVTPVVDLPNTAQAGQDGEVLALHLWNNKDDPAGQAAQNVLAAMRTESPTQPEVWLAAGVPPQNELWWRWRIVGFDNRGDSGWSVLNTDWHPLGAYSALPVGRIPPDCAVYFEAKRHPPSTAAAGAWRHQAVFFLDEYAQPIPHALGLLRRGILTGIGDVERSGIVFGCSVTASNPPDDQVHTDAGMWVHQGHQYGKVAEAHAFDLVDGNGAALASEESFWTALTLRDGTVGLTKGAKAIVPQKPTVDATEPFLRYVRIEYDPGGVPVIDEGDLDGQTLYDRFHFEPGVGLEGTLHAGQAIGASTWRYRSHSTPLVFEPDTTSYVWLAATGKPVVTTSPDAPEKAALLLWEVTTDTATILDVRDHRTYATSSRVLTLAGELPASPGEVDRLTVIDDRLFIERVTVDVPDLGGGTSGETMFDVLVNGASVYALSATDDRRPRFAFNAAELGHQDSVPELLELRRGDELVLATAQHAEGGTPARAKVQVLAWG